MGNLAILLKLLTQLGPIITWFLNNQASLQQILAVLKQLADALAPKVPNTTIAALSIGMTRQQLTDLLRATVDQVRVISALTPTPVDDMVVAVLAEAITSDWLLDLLMLMLTGNVKITEADLTAALATINAA